MIMEIKDILGYHIAQTTGAQETAKLLKALDDGQYFIIKKFPDHDVNIYFKKAGEKIYIREVTKIQYTRIYP